MAEIKERLAEISADYRGSVHDRSKLKPSKLLKSITGGSITTADAPSRNSYSVSGQRRTLVLTFMTVEERRRRIRLNAVKNKSQHRGIPGTRDASRQKAELAAKNKTGASGVSAFERSSAASKKREEAILVDMKFLHQSIFVFVRDLDESHPPYRIENRAINHAIYFRQRGCDGHPWNRLGPGETAAYVWEEPTKQKKLTVRVGMNLLTLQGVDGDERDWRTDRTTSAKKNSHAEGLKVLYPFSLIENEEQGGYGPTKSIRLEQIGFADYLPCPGGGGVKVNEGTDDVAELLCRVDTEGGTRLLIISDATDKVAGSAMDEERIMRRHLDTLKKQSQDEENRHDAFGEMKEEMKGRHGDAISRGSPALASIEESKEEVLSSIPEDSEIGSPDKRVTSAGTSAVDKAGVEKRIADIADYPEGMHITKCNQLLIEVLECVDLKASDLSGLSNPYAEVSLKQRHWSRTNLFHKRREKRKTYFIEKTLAPKWSQQPQVFVFDVPEEASHVTRGYKVRVSVRSFKGLFAAAPFLGQTDVHLRSLLSEKESIGWYPLTGKAGQREVLTSASRIRGSVKLRVQWIYSPTALLEYYILLSQVRCSCCRLV